jgi:hypothetical protein
MLVTLEAYALTAVTLRAATDADLVDLGALGAARNEPAAGALVAAEDLVAHELEKPQAAQDVRRLWFGGGGLRWVR